MNRPRHDEQRTQRPDTGRLPRGGFTLVEMLVSVALVLLMMTIFASAFQIATGTLLKQRGASQNNQRARAVVTMLQGDLAKRTYQQRGDAITQPIYVVGGQDLLANRANSLARGIVSLHPDYFIDGVGGTGRTVDEHKERGYFYISENDPFNDADDVLQFTANATVIHLGDENRTPYTGRARPLGTTFGANASSDQPIWDDGVGFKINAAGNPITYAAGDTATSESNTAEVSYFIRNGNLMRRVLLIREPGLSQPPGPVGDEDQPTRTFPAPPAEFIPGNYTGTNDTGEDLSPTAFGDSDFWNDFDFSATRFDPELDQTTEPTRMRFNVATDLDNSVVFTPGLKPRALGNPQNRFGHDPSPRRITGFSQLQGRPKEHLLPTLVTSFMGRYTHEETSDPDFLFPGLVVPPADPLHAITPFSPDAGLTDGNGNGKVDLYENGPREGEDILMTNVHAFDIKVWDAALGVWADLGHANFNGDWHLRQTYNPNAPNGTFTLYDTSTAEVFPNASALRGMYRYGSLTPGVGPDGQPGIAGFDDDGDGPMDNATEIGWPGSDDPFNRVFDTWHPQFNFNTENDFLDPPANTSPTPLAELALDDPPPFRPLWTDRANFEFPIANGGSGGLRPVVWEPSQQYDFPSSVTLPSRVFPVPRQRAAGEFYAGHQSLFYQVVAVSDLGLGAAADYFTGPTEPAWPARAGEEVQDGEIRWRAFNNTIGLQAIQITVRFLDPTSQQMRQVTIIHPFVEL